MALSGYFKNCTEYRTLPHSLITPRPMRLLLLLLLGLMFNGCLFKDDIEEGPGCSNTCQYAKDGVCDDGGPGAVYSLCPCGTDCSDCGTRSSGDCNTIGGGGTGGGGTGGGGTGGGGTGGGGNSTTYNLVITRSNAHCSATAGTFFETCTGTAIIQLRETNGGIILNNGILDYCGAGYEGPLSSVNPPYCNSPNTLFVPNLVFGRSYTMTRTCEGFNGTYTKTRTFTVTSTNSPGPDGCYPQNAP
jgi:hypothetical protein